MIAALEEAPGAVPPMAAATWPEPARDRLLHVDPDTGRVAHRRPADLVDLLHPGDLLVVNDAGTLPARLAGQARGRPVELRLAAWRSEGPLPVVLMGEGSWRQDTDHRPPPPALAPGEEVALPGTRATVASVSPLSPRLLEVDLPLRGDARLSFLLAHGRPVQYSYLAAELPGDRVQTAYAGRPWAVEMPSAGRPLTWTLLTALARKGVGLARLTHGAGLSATGDPALDAALPLPERYDLPAETVAALHRTRDRGGRVVAVGTSVVRALEDAALRGLPPGEGLAALVIGPDHRLSMVDGLLTNMHGPGESHFRLALALADEGLLAHAWREAVAAGYRAHEFGDVALVLPGRAT